MDRILAIAEKHGIPVVEDAAQSLSARYRSERFGEIRQAGSMGTTGTYSFFPSKNLGAFGDGGMVVTNDDELAGRLRKLRVHGEITRYHHMYLGWNSRLDALQAAVLRVKLPHLSAWSEARARNADRYDALFRASGLVDRGAVRLPARDPKCFHIFNQYTLRVQDRDGLGEHLKAKGIGWAVYYPRPLHLQECFAHLGHGEGSCPLAEQVGREVISIPVFPELTEDQQREVVEAVRGHSAFSFKG
jgi:dTDP-4-amino-4,6-dideoxygalactose transaminase